MTEQPVILRKISWSDLCPWAIIFRTLPVASSLTVLSLALAGVLVSPVGWWISEQLFVNQSLQEDAQFMEIVHSNNSPFRGVLRDLPDGQRSLEVWGMRINGPREVFRQYIGPYQSLFDRSFNLRQFLYFLFGAAWTLAIWGFAGLAITRVCLVRLTRNEFLGLDDAVDFARGKWLTAVQAIGAPLLGAFALAIPAFLMGLLMTFDFGVLLVGLSWIFVLLLAAGIGIILFGLMFGWPLMIASVGCENQNAFDAMTRSYSYTFQRPLHYLFYAVLAILFGGFCWIVIAALSDGVVELSYWSTSWGANVASSDRMDEVLAGPADNNEGTPVSTSLSVGRHAIGFWSGLIRSVAAAFLYGLFWCMASAVYLLLRRDLDETEMDEMVIDEEQRSYQLPPLRSDEQGIPQVVESSESSESIAQENDLDSDAGHIAN